MWANLSRYNHASYITTNIWSLQPVQTKYDKVSTSKKQTDKQSKKKIHFLAYSL